MKKDYNLKDYTPVEPYIERHYNPVEGTVYTLTVDWLPPGIKTRNEEEMNPPGTIVLTYDLTHQCCNRIIIVGDKGSDQFVFKTEKELDQWVLNQTGLKPGEDLHKRKTNNGISYTAMTDGYQVVARRIH